MDKNNHNSNDNDGKNTVSWEINKISHGIYDIESRIIKKSPETLTNRLLTQ